MEVNEQLNSIYTFINWNLTFHFRKFKNSKKSVDFRYRNRVISISNQARRTSKRRAERKRKKIWKNLLTKLMNKSSILICANEVEIQRWRDWSLKTEQKLNTKERQLFYKKRSFRDLKNKSQIKWRVWSWLRINAGGVPNTCKSNEES